MYSAAAQLAGEFEASTIASTSLGYTSGWNSLAEELEVDVEERFFKGQPIDISCHARIFLCGVYSCAEASWLGGYTALDKNDTSGSVGIFAKKNRPSPLHCLTSASLWNCTMGTG